jgi:peptidoglycan/xylan/chitin deacetylase (PgdA/CDA1 family)
MMFVASRRVQLLERYRVPYLVDEDTGHEGVLRIGRADGSGPELLAVAPPRGSTQHCRFILDGASLCTELANSSTVASVLREAGGDWCDGLPILDAGGVQKAAVHMRSDGSIVLPFDIDHPLDALLEERYQRATSPVKAVAYRGYYRARPLVPERLQIGLRRQFMRVQERASFPGWPIERALHHLESLMLTLVEQVGGEPLPWLAPWPGSFDWALVLTHDVERAKGYANILDVQSVEAHHGLRSAWFFVPERDYAVEDTKLVELQSRGCEIGLHGLRHDGRDMSPSEFPSRVPAMRSYAQKWGAVGFRGPSTHRDRNLIQELGVEYDSSWSDVARYEPQPGGCCSWLPFFIGDVVELPITLPQDHTLFEVQRAASDAPWVAKTEYIRENGGMALLLSHPDYLVQPERLESYEHYLAQFADDTTAWHALPREVAAWWRRRAESTVERRGGRWVIVGPCASDGAVRLGAPPTPGAGARVDAKRGPLAAEPSSRTMLRSSAPPA